MLGNVFVHEKFIFDDGTIGKKRFIVTAVTGDCLNDDPSSVILHVVRTTSQAGNDKFRPSAKGCYNDSRNVYKLDPNELKMFEIDTWIQFEVFDLLLAKLQLDKKNELIKGLGKIEDNYFKQILECMKYSEDIKTKYISMYSDILDNLNRK